MEVLFELTQTVKPGSVTERIKTFEDACRELSISKIELGVIGMDEDNNSIMAYAKLIIIARALNEGWKPDWTNSKQLKYYAWFELSSGSGLRCDGCGRRTSGSGVRSRLCFKTRELAEYAGKQFNNLYTDFFIYK